MRTPVMAANWKMNNTWAQTALLAQAVSNRTDDSWDSVEVVICPATCNIKAAQSVIEFDRAPFHLGAQNVHWEESGAFTGEVSCSMLSEMGATHCIVGHSERREWFCETDEMVNRKVAALLASHMTPIVCVGESLAIRDQETYVDYICNQVHAAFAGLTPQAVASCIVAYEPIWAIGTGRTATPEQAQEVCASIRSALAADFGKECADAVRILYGGSVNTANIEGLMSQPDIDGGLVGGASLDADSFKDLVKACTR